MNFKEHCLKYNVNFYYYFYDADIVFIVYKLLLEKLYLNHQEVIKLLFDEQYHEFANNKKIYLKIEKRFISLIYKDIINISKYKVNFYFFIASFFILMDIGY
jgi:hypothetical protein